MKKSAIWILSVAGVLVSLAGAGECTDRTGVLGLNYTLGPSFIVGGDRAQDVSTVEPGVGAALQLGIMPMADLLFSYDYIDASLHTQAITFGGQMRLTSNETFYPVVGAGMGFGKPFTGEGWDHLALKLSGGVEKELNADTALAGLLTYQFVDGNEPFGSVHSMTPGLRLVYHFANLTKR